MTVTEIVAYSLAVAFAFYANLLRERLDKRTNSLPKNIRQIYWGEE